MCKKGFFFEFLVAVWGWLIDGSLRVLCHSFVSIKAVGARGRWVSFTSHRKHLLRNRFEDLYIKELMLLCIAKIRFWGRGSRCTWLHSTNLKDLSISGWPCVGKSCTCRFLSQVAEEMYAVNLLGKDGKRIPSKGLKQEFRSCWNEFCCISETNMKYVNNYKLFFRILGGRDVCVCIFIYYLLISEILGFRHLPLLGYVLKDGGWTMFLKRERFYQRNNHFQTFLARI